MTSPTTSLTTSLTTRALRATLAAALIPAAAHAALAPAAGAQASAPYASVAPASGAKRVRFTVRIENVSTPATLRLSDGTTAPAPTSPGVWAVHRGANPIHAPGASAGATGLEAQAEDGDPAMLAAAVARTTGVVASGAFTTPLGQSMAGPLLPGQVEEITFTASPGELLSLAMMFGQSNDTYLANGARGIALFDAAGGAVSGDITARLMLWDAGTEANEEPGLGASQAPRQAAPNTGAAERASIRPARETAFGEELPPVARIVKVTLTPGTATASR
jgi:hypothetical protein